MNLVALVACSHLVRWSWSSPARNVHVLSARWDRNQVIMLPSAKYQCWKTDSKQSWSTILKAELKSSRSRETSTVVLCRPQERCHVGPYSIKAAVSVQWWRRLPGRKKAVLLTVGDKAHHDESWAPKSWSLSVCKMIPWTAKTGAARKNEVMTTCLAYRGAAGTQGFIQPRHRPRVSPGAATGYVTWAVNSDWSISPVQPPPPEQSSTVNEMVPDFGELKKSSSRYEKVWQTVSIEETTHVSTIYVESCCHFLPLRSLQYLDVFYTSARWFSNESNSYIAMETSTGTEKWKPQRKHRIDN